MNPSLLDLLHQELTNRNQNDGPRLTLAMPVVGVFVGHCSTADVTGLSDQGTYLFEKLIIEEITLHHQRLDLSLQATLFVNS